MKDIENNRKDRGWEIYRDRHTRRIKTDTESKAQSCWATILRTKKQRRC